MVGTKRNLYKDIWKSERNVVCGMASHTGKIDMIRGSIIKSAALFALPICVGNILQQLYGTVDTLVVGNFCDSAALAAVGTATQPMEILLCVFWASATGRPSLFLRKWAAAMRMGCACWCAQRCGFVSVRHPGHDTGNVCRPGAAAADAGPGRCL